jgi:hypothetical protein
MAVGAMTAVPVTIFPSINAVGAKRFTKTLLPDRRSIESAIAGLDDGHDQDGPVCVFPRLQRPNRLLYRCFPLTCARSQE